MLFLQKLAKNDCSALVNSRSEGLGCDAVRVSQSSQLAPALKRGLAHDGVSLIDVMVDSAVPLLYARKN
jgi:benzoylformate decarboxylase